MTDGPIKAFSSPDFRAGFQGGRATLLFEDDVQQLSAGQTVRAAEDGQLYKLADPIVGQGRKWQATVVAEDPPPH